MNERKKLADFHIVVTRGPAELEGMAADYAEPGQVGQDFTSFTLDGESHGERMQHPLVMIEQDTLELSGKGYCMWIGFGNHLLPMTLKWRIEKTCRDTPREEEGIVCVMSDYDVCIGRFATPLARAMVQRLNL